MCDLLDFWFDLRLQLLLFFAKFQVFLDDWVCLLKLLVLAVHLLKFGLLLHVLGTSRSELLVFLLDLLNVYLGQLC